MSKYDTEDLGEAAEPITPNYNYWDDPHVQDGIESGVFFVVAVTVIILFVVVSLLVDHLPDKLSEKVSRSTPFIFIGIPIIVGFIYEFVFN